MRVTIFTASPSCLFTFSASTNLRRACAPAAHMYKPLTAHPIVSRIAVRLQNAFPFIEKLLWPRATAAEPKVEYRLPTGPTVLPQIRLMIRAALVMHLHRHDGFIGLQIGRSQ